MRVFALLIPVLMTAAAQATLNRDFERGENRLALPSTGTTAELCVMPKHFPGANYSARDLKTEHDLCSLTFHQNVAVCAKINSSNPGLDVFIPRGENTVAQVQASDCDKKIGQKIAKYKLSTSCSYSPSLLAYYHVSRILGGVAGVPPSVLRTVDIQNHRKIADAITKRLKAGSLISKTWNTLTAALRAGLRSPSKDELFTDDGKQSYGALMQNPLGEEFYEDFYNGGKGSARISNFKSLNKFVKLLATSQGIERSIGREFNPANVQLMVAVKDASELIILDTLLNQQDRMGNIHGIKAGYYFDRADGKLKHEVDMKKAEAAALGAVRVQKLLLKDNDCGVAKSNRAKAINLLSRVNHIDPETYRRLVNFDAIADRPEVKTFFVEELLFTAKDFASVRRNLKEVAAYLYKGCNDGTLKLDLDLEAHFLNKAPFSPGCEPQL